MQKLITLFICFNLLLSSEIPEFLKNEDPREISHEKFLSLTNGLGCVKKFHEHRSNRLHGEFLPVEKRNYDIKRIDLLLDWSETLDSDDNYDWNGVSEIEFDLLDVEVDSIELDCEGLKIDSINLNGLNIIQNIRMTVDKLIIYSNEIEQKENQLYIEYSYKYIKNNGFLRYGKDRFYHKIAYTQSQPNEARTWMPCNDNPYEKQLTSIAIKVPKTDEVGKPFVTASNGQLIDSSFSDNAVTYYWEHDYPIPSYLMVANASNFQRWEEKVPRLGNNQDSIVLSYYVWPEDMSGVNNSDSTFDVKEDAFNVIPDMMQKMTRYFGEYPFKKFGSVSVAGFPYGGMEHQSIQTIRRSWLNGSVGGFSHELAHMWIGDLVTCGSWNDIWMNEGGAVFGTMLYMEKAWAPEWRHAEKDASRDYYLLTGGLNLTPLYFTDADFVFSSERIPVIYSKAGWVYLMLRNYLGEKAFYKVLQKYFNEFSFSYADTEDFREFLKKNTEKDIDKFFEQWVYSSGHPVYNFEAESYPMGNKFQTVVRLEQIQDQLTLRDDSHETFEVPLRILMDHKNGQDTVQVFNDKKDQEFIVLTNEKITDVNLDFRFTLFELNERIVSSISYRKEIEMRVFPNVVSEGNDLNIESNYRIKKIQIVDELGRTHLEKTVDLHNSIKLKLNIPAGKYFVRSIGEKISSSKLIIVQ